MGHAPYTTDEAAEVLRWLARHPVEFDTLLTLVQLENGTRRPLGFTATTETQERVEGFLRAAGYGACPKCHWPVVFYPDGTFIDWPLRPEIGHAC